MTDKELLEELTLALEGTVDQIGRAQRLSIAGEAGLPNLRDRIEQIYAAAVAVRNETREALMKQLSRVPKKLPVL